MNRRLTPFPERFEKEHVLVLASEPRDEEEALQDPVYQGFKKQLVLVLAPEGPPDSTSASEGSPGTVKSKPDSKPDSKPPEFQRISGGSSTLLRRPPDHQFLCCRPPRSLCPCWPPCLRLRHRPPRSLRLCWPPDLCAWSRTILEQLVLPQSYSLHQHI
ncbi:hypothetical protein AMECASPLE_027692 [Ameca splendens]|uniref:Uncharacterized protein n=1 Tax=Ameca splendens TaxID=208324 RepID=A0ABV0Y5Q6_9TELE